MSGLRLPTVLDIVGDMGQPLEHDSRERAEAVEEREAAVVGLGSIDDRGEWRSCAPTKAPLV